MQMSIFHELMPKKSRSLVRVALGHFKDLQDSAASEEEKISLRRTFALSLYVGRFTVFGLMSMFKSDPIYRQGMRSPRRTRRKPA